MAADKNSFILYTDNKEMVENLSDEQAGKLFKHIFRYVNDENPITEDQIVNIAFIPIKQSFKRDLKKWEEKKINKTNGGKLGNLKRWNKDLYDKVTNEEITLKDAERIAQERKVSHSDKKESLREKKSDSVAVSDSVSVSVSVSDIIDKSIIIDEHEVIAKFNEITGKRTRTINGKVRGQLSQRIKDGYSLDEIYTAIANCHKDDFHKKNPQYLTLEFITRADKLDKWINSVEHKAIAKDGTKWMYPEYSDPKHPKFNLNFDYPIELEFEKDISEIIEMCKQGKFKKL